MVADFKQGTNLAGQILASGQLASTAINTIYTVPAASATKVATMALFNNGNAPVTVAVYVTPSGNAVGATRMMLGTYSLGALDGMTSEDVLSFIKGAMLDAGAFISVSCSVANVLNYLLTGAVSS